ncbi:MAG: response regulator [Acidimicrobiales bacterium]
MRVVVVDDHDMVRDGLVAMLTLDERLDVVGAASTIRGCIQNLAHWRPDVLIADDQLPDGRGADLADHITSEMPSCAVLMISGVDRPGAVESAIRSGCSGFLSKALSTEDLADAILAVHRGVEVYPAAVLRRLAESNASSPAEPLTRRELEVLRLLARPLSIQEISEKLAISQHTVRNHIRGVRTKLEARTQLEAVVIGLRYGLISFERTGQL